MIDFKDIVYQIQNKVEAPKFLKKLRTQYTIIILVLITFYTLFVSVSLVRFKQAEVDGYVNEIRKEAYKSTDAYNLFLRVLEINPKKHKIKVAGTFLMGDALKRQTEKDFPNRNVTYFFNSKEMTKRLEHNWTWDFNQTITFEYGDINLYPFDKYQTLLEISVWDEDSVSRQPKIVFEGITQGYEIDQEKEASYDEIETLYLNIRRSNTVISFTIIILMAMWALSFAYLYMVLKVACYKLPPVPNLLPLGCMILFAFPNLRNVMPDVPLIGCWVDTFGYLWTMAIVAIATIICIFDYLYKNMN